MKNKTICILAVVCIVVSLVITIGCTNGTDNTVKIGYKKHLAYMPLFVAEEKGFFGDMKIETIEFDSTNQMMQALATGKIDVVLGGANLQTIFSVLGKSQDSVKIFSLSYFETGQGFSCVLVNKDSEINDVSELNNKIVATLPGTYGPWWTENALKEFNAGAEIREIAPSLQGVSIMSGEVDALFTVEPVCSFAVNKGIARSILNDPMQYSGNIFAASVISDEFNHKHIKESIFNAMQKAIDFINQNPDEAVRIAAVYSGYETELIKGMQPLTYRTISREDIDELQKTADEMCENGVIENNVALR